MNDPRTLEALARSTLALRLLRNPAAARTTASGSQTKTVRIPVYIDQLTIQGPPADDQGNVLPYVVLLDVDHGKDLVTWPDVRVEPTRKLPPETDISTMELIATSNEDVWKSVRQSIIDGIDNGEPGNAGNGNGVPH